MLPKIISPMPVYEMPQPIQHQERRETNHEVDDGELLRRTREYRERAARAKLISRTALIVSLAVAAYFAVSAARNKAQRIEEHDAAAQASPVPSPTMPAPAPVAVVNAQPKPLPQPQPKPPFTPPFRAIEDGKEERTGFPPIALHRVKAAEVAFEIEALENEIAEREATFKRRKDMGEVFPGSREKIDSLKSDLATKRGELKSIEDAIAALSRDPGK